MTAFSDLGRGDTLTIPDTRFTDAILHFVAGSPLAACTTTGFDLGSHIVRTDRPLAMLSDGERHLWAFLRSLVAGDLRDLLGAVDSLTTAAMGDLFARVTLAGYDAPVGAA